MKRAEASRKAIDSAQQAVAASGMSGKKSGNPKNKTPPKPQAPTGIASNGDKVTKHLAQSARRSAGAGRRSCDKKAARSSPISRGCQVSSSRPPRGIALSAARTGPEARDGAVEVGAGRSREAGCEI